jgi:hypothetical protein
MDRTTPPSARSAVPLIADASGLHTKATTAPTSSVVANRCKSDVGLTFWKKSRSMD